MSEGTVVDAKQSGRSLLHPTCLCQRTQQDHLLVGSEIVVEIAADKLRGQRQGRHLGQRRARWGRFVSNSLEAQYVVGQMLFVNRFAIAERHRMLDDIFQLPDIARIAVFLQAPRSADRQPLHRLLM